MNGHRSYTLEFKSAKGWTIQSILAASEAEARQISAGQLLQAGVESGILFSGTFETPSASIGTIQASNL